MPAAFGLVAPSLPYLRRFCLLLLVGTSIAGMAQVSSAGPSPASSNTPAGQSVEPTAAKGSLAGWYFTLSPYTHHWYARPEHRHVWLAGIERYDPDNSLMGFAFFQNSFGEPTVYIYPWGQSYPNLFGVEKLTGKWSAGLLYGYLGRWQHEVPFNHHGFSPGFIPALSWKFDNGYEAQLNVPNLNVMFQLQIPLKNFAR